LVLPLFASALFCGTVRAAQDNVLNLEGEGQHLVLPANVCRDLAAATVEAWVKWTSDEPGMRWFSIGEFNEDAGIGRAQGRDPAALMFFIVDPRQGPKTVHVGGLLREQQWCHIAATCGPAGMRLFFNGVLVAQNDATNSLNSVRSGDQGFLGKWNGSPDFRGQLDDVRIWSLQRTEEQIRQGMAEPVDPAAAGLVAWWRFDAGTADDVTPSGRPGKFEGGASVVAADRPAAAALEAPAVVFGLVSDETGKPASNASVQLTAAGAQVASGSASETGEFSIATYASNAVYEVSASAGNRRAKQSAVRLNPRQRLRADLVVRPNVNLAGRVVNQQSGSGLNAVVVQALAVAGDAPGAEAAGAAFAPLKLAATVLTDRDGRFQFIDLPPGSYRVRCHTDQNVVDLRDGNVTRIEQDRPVLDLEFRLGWNKARVTRSYTTADGLLHSNVTALALGPEPALWAAGGGGLARLSASGVEQLPVPGLKDGQGPTALLRAVNGDLWIATEDGLWRYSQRDGRGRLTRFTSAQGLLQNRVLALWQDARGGVWAGTDFGVCAFDGERFRETGAGTNGVVPRFVSALAGAPEGSLWVASLGEGLFRRTGDLGWTRFSWEQGLRQRRLSALTMDGEGTLWIGLAGGGLMRRESTNFTAITVRVGLLGGRVRCLLADKGGVLWAGGDRGLTRYDRARIVHYTSADGLAHDQVHAIARAADGALWIATAAGLSRLDAEPPVAAPTGPGFEPAPERPPRILTPELDPPALAPAADHASSLRQRWRAGERYYYRIESEGSYENVTGNQQQRWRQENFTAQVCSLSAAPERDGGVRQLEWELRAQEFVVRSGQQVWIDFDSKGDVPENDRRPFVGVLKQLPGLRLQLLLDAQGRLEKLTGLEEFVSEKLKGMPPWVRSFSRQFCNEDSLRQLVDMSQLLPDRAGMPEGTGWQRQVELKFTRPDGAFFALHFTAKGAETIDGRRCVRFDFSGGLAGGPTPGSFFAPPSQDVLLAGTLRYDPELEAVRELRLREVSFNRWEDGNREGMGYATQNMTLELVEHGPLAAAP
jgi:hypothetical protein